MTESQFKKPPYEFIPRASDTALLPHIHISSKFFQLKYFLTANSTRIQGLVNDGNVYGSVDDSDRLERY